jgi:fido (protein-threonine AMPylation protein)
MARRQRKTEPVETTRGVLRTYAEVEELLGEGELRGRRWLYDRARAGPPHTPTDADILDLHLEMFRDIFAWAGRTRIDERGPNGIVNVHFTQVRPQLREFTLDLAARFAALVEPDVRDMVELIAYAHHKFQWIHPFQDTNGRTGRVLDHYLLHVTFGLVEDDFASTRVLEYFPTEQHESAYYDGLTDADHHRPERLQAFYEERIMAALETTPEFSELPRSR